MFKFLIKGWFVLLAIGMVYASIMYVVGNDSLDAVDEATPEELIYTVGARIQGNEAEVLNRLKRVGIDTSLEFGDALDENSLIEDYDIDFVDTDESRQVYKIAGEKLVEVKALMKSGITLSMIFTTKDKVFMRGLGGIGPMVRYTVSNGSETYNLSPEEMAPALFGLFADNDEANTFLMSKLESYLIRERANSIPVIEENPDVDASIDEVTSVPEAITQAASSALNEAIETMVLSDTASDGGSEYVDARTLRMADVDGDGENEALVLYTIEGQGGGNGYFRKLAVFKSVDGEYQVQANTVVNGAADDVKVLTKNLIAVTGLTVGPEDAMCCPTQESEERYVLDGKQLNFTVTPE